jgi:hypothetical protein
LREFPKTRILYCEIDPLRDLTTQFIWRLKKLGVNLDAYLLENWCHGTLSFDLKFGGIPESHKSNQLNVEFFREIFDSNYKNKNALQWLEKIKSPESKNN